MGLAWFTFDGLMAHFHGLVCGFGRMRARSASRHTAARNRPTGLQMQAGRAHVACAPACRSTAQRRPLRVMRVVEACHAPSSAGRMVISGRMADVCAELDRLAALEAAGS
jgi:hypothetical protein